MENQVIITIIIIVIVIIIITIIITIIIIIITITIPIIITIFCEVKLLLSIIVLLLERRDLWRIRSCWFRLDQLFPVSNISRPSVSVFALWHFSAPYHSTIVYGRSFLQHLLIIFRPPVLCFLWSCRDVAGVKDDRRRRGLAIRGNGVQWAWN